MRWKTALPDPRLVATAVIALGGLITFLINFPGSMEDDSFVQLVEGREDFYSNWHPPVMSWLLGLSDQLPGPAAGWFTGFEMLVCFGTLALVLWLPKRVSWAAVAVAALMLPLPQLFMSQAVVWKDALFANASFAGFVAIALAAKLWPRRAVRWALLVLSSAFLALAVLTRQNGAVIVPFAVLALAVVAWRLEGRWRTALIHGAALFAATVVIAWGGNALLQLQADGYPAKQEQFKILYLYDITGMVKRDPAIKLAVFDRDAPVLARTVRQKAVPLWSPVKNDTMETDDIIAVKDAVPASVVTRQWKALIAEHPGLYLRVRAQLFRWVFQPPDVGLCHPFHVGDQGGEEEMKELGAKPRLDARDIALWHYGDFFQYHTPLFSHTLFAVLGIGVLVIVLRRREPADIVLAALIGATAVFTATFFILSIACDYRYLYLIDLTALAGALYVAADWRALLKR
ncbi:hypothetical protein GCM10008942_29300 [Rhizomicrobium electricum]|uniref:Glycosyltransferase RgtA/B/C/D-like domain-containing protein n=2 Tax=Rhizomicrobium electricum TaxID=480070 RepID=A0ABN1F0J9_9PROT